MLLGRFAYVLPVLAMAGALAAKPKLAAERRHLPDRRAAVRRPAGRRDPHHGRPAVLPRPGARPDRRALPGAADRRRASTDLPSEPDYPMTDMPPTSTSATRAARRSRPPRSRPACCCAPSRTPSSSSTRASSPSNPVILATEIVALLATISTIDAFRTGADIPGGRSRSRSGSGSPWCSPTSPRASPKGRGKAAADALRAQRVDVKAKLIVDDKRALIVPTPAYKLVAGQRGAGRGRRHGARPTARSSRASPRSTRRRSPANPRR